MAEKRAKKESHDRIEGGVGSILKGLGDLVEKLQELSETGEETSRTGEIRGAGNQVKGIYGFTVKVGLGEKTPHIEPFGNIRRDDRSGRAEVAEVREPPVDVFEEDGHLRVVAELPGVGKEDVQIDLEGDVLTISAKHREKKYRKEVLLPHTVSKETLRYSCNNGVLEIRCAKES
jgi:HSP20 family protein